MSTLTGRGAGLLQNHPRANRRREHCGDGGQHLPRGVAVRRAGAVAAVGVAVTRRGGPRRLATDLVVLVRVLFVAVPRHFWKQFGG